MRKLFLPLLFFVAILPIFSLQVAYGTPASTTDCVRDKNDNCVGLKPGQVTIKPTDVNNLQQISADDIIKNTLNGVYAVTAVIAVIVIVAAGLLFITSDGDPAKTSRAKNAIIYASVGLVIVGSAFIITGVIQKIGS